MELLVAFSLLSSAVDKGLSSGNGDGGRFKIISCIVKRGISGPSVRVVIR